MLKVLFITRKWPPAVGGMETYALELSKELARLCDLSVRFLPGRANRKPPTMVSLASFVLSSVLFVATSERRDVIHIGDLVLWPLCLVARIFQPTAKLAITAYGLDIVYGSRKGLLPSFYRVYLALGVRLTAKRLQVISISNSTAKLCREIGFTNVSVVPLGVNTITKIGDEPIDIGQYVLFVGRLVERKGAAWFTQNVLPLLPTNVRLVVVGKRWDETEWQAISANERVEYRGVVSDAELHVLRRSALAVLMPNIPTDGKDIEGFGLTALEAAADGGVLLASGIEGIVDAVVNGETGFLLPAEDADSWASKINEIMLWSKKERTSFIGRARAIIDDRFSWEHVARNTLGVYERCLQARKYN